MVYGKNLKNFMKKRRHGVREKFKEFYEKEKTRLVMMISLTNSMSEIESVGVPKLKTY